MILNVEIYWTSECLTDLINFTEYPKLWSTNELYLYTIVDRAISYSIGFSLLFTYLNQFQDKIPLTYNAAANLDISIQNIYVYTIKHICIYNINLIGQSGTEDREYTGIQ